jgi:hypothetical protein
VATGCVNLVIGLAVLSLLMSVMARTVHLAPATPH